MSESLIFPSPDWFRVCSSCRLPPCCEDCEAPLLTTSICCGRELMLSPLTTAVAAGIVNLPEFEALSIYVYVYLTERVCLPFTMVILVLLPFWGPHTSWKSPPASQLKSLGLLSPSTMNVTLKFSPVATRFGASTVRFWAYASLHRSASAAHIIIFLFIIFGYQFFSFSRDFSISAFSLLTLS